MPGELGKCPTCKKEISTSAESCPHCGECKFAGHIVDNDNPVIRCFGCGGRCVVGEKQCNICRGTGAVQGIKYVKDLRVYKETFTQQPEDISRPRPASWGPPNTSSGGGCFSVIILFLSVAASVLILFSK